MSESVCPLCGGSGRVRRGVRFSVELEEKLGRLVDEIAEKRKIKSKKKGAY